MKNERNEQLKGLIQNGMTEQAIEMVRSVLDYHEGEEFVFTVLREEKSAPELVEAILEVFFGTRENRYKQHGYWVHSLSHFTKILWERRMDGWIKKFNEVSFKGANELHDSNCSDRLIGDFGKFAKFDDDPADFHITLENVRWMDWSDLGVKARIEAGHFESEVAFLRWELATPETYMDRSWDFIETVVRPGRIRTTIQRLQDLGVDTSEYRSFEQKLLVKQLDELEGKLPTMKNDWECERLKECIQPIKEAMAALSQG